MGTYLSRGPAGEATCTSKAGDDGGLKGAEKSVSPDRAPLESGRREQRSLSPNWETVGGDLRVRAMSPTNERNGRSYADVCRTGVEQGKMSQLRLRHFTKQPRETPKNKKV